MVNLSGSIFNINIVKNGTGNLVSFTEIDGLKIGSSVCTSRVSRQITFSKHEENFENSFEVLPILYRNYK